MSEESYIEDLSDSYNSYSEDSSDNESSKDLSSEVFEDPSEESEDYHFHQLKSEEDDNGDGTFCIPKHLCPDKPKETKKDKIKMVINEKSTKGNDKKIISKSNKQKEVCSSNTSNKTKTTSGTSDKKINAAAKTIGGIWKK